MLKTIKFRNREYQVWEGRRIIGRYDLLSQAKKAHPDAFDMSN